MVHHCALRAMRWQLCGLECVWLPVSFTARKCNHAHILIRKEKLIESDSKKQNRDINYNRNYKL